MRLQAHDTKESILPFSLFLCGYESKNVFSFVYFQPTKTHSCHFHSHINSHCSFRVWRVKEREREIRRMEEDFQGRPAELQLQCCSARIMSPEIVEISEESKTIISSQDGGATDVYVAVGKDDIDVLKWALDHAVSPGCCVFLVHVFPPLTYISTPGSQDFYFLSSFFHLSDHNQSVNNSSWLFFLHNLSVLDV